MFWLIVGLIAAAVAAALAVPLVLARGRAAGDAAAHDRAVYRDQLEEVERDLSRGLLSAAEAEAARLEIKRRILRTERPGPAATGEAATGPARRPAPAGFLAFALALLVPAAALGIYLLTGTPGMPDMPLAERLRNAPMLAGRPGGAPGGGRGPTPEQMRQAGAMDPAAQAEMIAGMVDGLEARLEEQPDDFEGWMRLGRARLLLGELPAAREAYRRATGLRPDSLPAAGAYAEAVLRSDGVDMPVSAEARAALHRVLEIDPNDGWALFLLGRAAGEAQDWPGALGWFRRLQASLPPDDPGAALVGRIVEELQQRQEQAAPAAGGTPEQPR